MKKGLTIGEMARHNGISVQRLRLYSNMGLLEPAWVDEQTGYRYYSTEQSERLLLIQSLQYVGMSLKELKALFEQPDCDLDTALEKILLDIERDEQILARRRRLIACFQQRDEPTAAQLATGGFHLLESEKQTQPLALDLSPATSPYRIFFRDALKSLQLSRSYKVFFGIKKEAAGDAALYSAFLQLDAEKPYLPLPWLPYSSLQMRSVSAEEAQHLLTQERQIMLRKYPQFPGQDIKYRAILSREH